ncbi:MAG: glycosyltransferase family 4 protein [Bacteroides sp.]|nr:glycosyltransferase family 4 protein [Bacteroides sp.]
MKILFLSLARFDDINVRGIYSDLMREFIARGHDVFIASPIERRFRKQTHLIDFPLCQILKIRTLNLQKTNIIEKGIGTLLLEYQFDNAIKKYWGDIKFDLVLYATPPITFNRVIERIKKRCGCRSYLMLKDIFPQNAVDIGMMKEGGLLHCMFRKKEVRLYEISDRIGCMSPANCEYVLKHNPTVDPSKVELCPNSITPIEIPVLSEDERVTLLMKLSIPTDKTLFIYGGNLGKPQGLDFLLKVIEANENREDSYIVVVGSGTEYPKIARWFEVNNPVNSKLLSALPKQEYDNLVRACHVGLIFLDPRFTIPNFPSRLLSYLENSMPVLLATDVNTDMGRIAEGEDFGLWCESDDLDKFMKNMDALTSDSISKMGIAGHKYFLANYTTDIIADSILIPNKKSKI